MSKDQADKAIDHSRVLKKRPDSKNGIYWQLGVDEQISICGRMSPLVRLHGILHEIIEVAGPTSAVIGQEEEPATLIKERPVSVMDTRDPIQPAAGLGTGRNISKFQEQPKE